jgi:hypothetical protein
VIAVLDPFLARVDWIDWAAGCKSTHAQGRCP